MMQYLLCVVCMTSTMLAKYVVQLGRHIFHSWFLNDGIIQANLFGSSDTFHLSCDAKVLSRGLHYQRGALQLARKGAVPRHVQDV